jgi:hypothetical protein
MPTPSAHPLFIVELWHYTEDDASIVTCNYNFCYFPHKEPFPSTYILQLLVVTLLTLFIRVSNGCRTTNYNKQTHKHIHTRIVGKLCSIQHSDKQSTFQTLSAYPHRRRSISLYSLSFNTNRKYVSAQRYRAPSASQHPLALEHYLFQHIISIVNSMSE